jgi:tRNA G10  N-methylase Trm11
VYFALLDLENKDLALKELETYTTIKKCIKNFCLTDVINFNFFAYIKYYGYFLGKFNLEELINFLKNKSKIALLVYSEFEKNERNEIFKPILENLKNKIDYKNGKKYVIFIDKKENFYLGEVIWERESFKEREPKNRPFNRPFTLKPKFARALINLTKDNLIVDPFAGTGTILIEAFFSKRDYFGIERDWKIINGCYKNLEYFGLRKKKVILSDALYIDKLLKKLNSFSVVTDLPYGKSSSLFGKKLIDLYESFLDKLLNTNVNKAVIVLKKGEEGEYIKNKYKELLKFDCSHFVNSNLTRNILLFDFTRNI